MAGLLGVPWFAARFKGNGLVRDFGLRFEPADILLGLGVGVVGQFVLVPLVYLPLFWLFDVDHDDLAEPAAS